MAGPARAIAALALVAPLLLGDGSSPARAAAAMRYDVLGDSYAAGYGVPPYTSDCRRSEASYGVLLDGRAGLVLDDLVACSGASTTSMVEGGQLGALDDATDLVLLSIGANDVAWSKPAVACALRTNAECVAATAELNRAVAEDLPERLDALLAEVELAAPDARVLLTGYPRLFSPGYGAYLNASPIEQKRINDATDLLNSAARTSASEQGFGFVDVTTRFAGRGLNAPDPWIHSLRLPSGEIDRRAFHPTAVGYDAYVRAIIVALRQAPTGDDHGAGWCRGVGPVV